MSGKRKTSSEWDEDRERFERDQCERRAAEDRAKAAILEALSADHPRFAFNFLHAHTLYGSVGSIKVGDTFHRYGVEDTDTCATWEEVGALLAEFPPVPIILHRAGCVGVRPASADDDKGERSDLWPVTVRISNHPDIGGPCALVEWYTQLRPGLLVSFDVYLRRDAHPVAMRVDVKRDRSTGTLISAKRQGLTPAGWFVQAFAESERVNYAGGSQTDPGESLIHWPLDETDPEPVSARWLRMRQTTT